MADTFNLLSWLRRNPKPRKLRLVVEDGDERIVDLGTARIRWAEVEQTVINAGATHIECLDPKGEILRGYRLAEQDAVSPEDAQIKDTDKLVARTQSTNAAMLDAYGKRLVESFNAGAAAAAVSQESLVAIVQTMTEQLSLAITNQLNLAANYANAVAHGGDSDGGGDTKSDALMGMIGAMISKQLQPPAAPVNGAKKHE